MTKLVFSLLTLFCVGQANALPINSLNFSNPMDALDVTVFPDAFTPDYDFEGIVALNNCSGGLVRFADSADSELAMVLTNGHCMEGGFIKPGKHYVAKKSSRTFTLLKKDAKSAGRVSATEILYGTMTGTDMALYQLAKTYAEIASEFSLSPLTLSPEKAVEKDGIEVISGYWKRGYRCDHAGEVHKLKEAGYTWNNSIRYSQPGCETIGGTSGSPVLAAGTKTVIGVNNTGNESGAECTMNNPCEEDENGKVSFAKGNSYGQQINLIYDCIGADHKVDLSLAGCKLPREADATL